MVAPEAENLTPGLTGVLAAVETGRCIHQRMLTYTLNKIVKTFQIAWS